jgi:hypothetical protein
MLLVPSEVMSLQIKKELSYLARMLNDDENMLFSFGQGQKAIAFFEVFLTLGTL